MALKGLSLAAQFKFVSKYDTGDDPTVFEYGALDSRIAAMLRDKGTTITVNPAAMEDEVDSQINANKVNFDAVVYGCRGWSNFKDEAGNDIPFRTLKRNHGGVSYTVADPAVVMLIPNAVIQEFGQKIMADNDMSADDVKN